MALPVKFPPAEHEPCVCIIVIVAVSGEPASVVDPLKPIAICAAPEMDEPIPDSEPVGAAPEINPVAAFTVHVPSDGVVFDGSALTKIEAEKECAFVVLLSLI